MDARLVIASKREVRDYDTREIPEDVRLRILDAGRLAGSANNRQPWRFLVVEAEGLRRQVADSVYAPGNVLGARLVVVIAVGGKGPLAFDAGRAVQNMMLAAWNEGVGSCPNGSGDFDALAGVLGLEEGERPVIVLTFGYPTRPRDPQRRSPEDWSARAWRKPLDEIVKTL